MKIAFVLGGLHGNGGIGRVVMIIANALAREENIDYEVSLVTMQPWEPEKHIYQTDEAIKGYGLDIGNSMHQIIQNGGIHRLKKYFDKEHIDVVVACGALFFPMCVIASRRNHAKCVCWEHSNANNKADHRGQMLCRWFGARFGTEVLVLTKCDYEIYKRRFHPKKITQIYNPVAPESKKSTRYDVSSRKIITVGRLCYQKNYPALLRIARKVLTAHPDWTWDIYGSGPDKDEIVKKIEQYRLIDKVILKGQVSDLYDRYQQYAFLVMTSHYEGFSMVLLEAINNAIPIMAFDVECGPSEVIIDDGNGYLIPAFDEADMVERINRLCDSEKERVRLSDGALKSVERFSLKRIVSEWDSFLAKM